MPQEEVVSYQDRGSVLQERDPGNPHANMFIKVDKQTHLVNILSFHFGCLTIHLISKPVGFQAALYFFIFPNNLPSLLMPALVRITKSPTSKPPGGSDSPKKSVLLSRRERTVV